MKLETIERIAKETMGARVEHGEREPGWIYFHGLRTARLAMWLADELEVRVDRDVLYAAGLFHDIGKGTHPHNEIGAVRTREILAGHCTPEELELIETLIVGHCLRGVPDQSEPEHILQDADVLDHIGPIGPWLAYYWSGSRGETFADHVHFFQSEECHNPRQKMYALLNFELARREYIRRIRYEDRVFQTLQAVYHEGVWPEEGPMNSGMDLWTPDEGDAAF